MARGKEARTATLRNVFIAGFAGFAVTVVAISALGIWNARGAKALLYQTYDRSLMSINYARAAAGDFADLSGAYERRWGREADPRRGGAIPEMVKTVMEDLDVAIERSQSAQAARAGREVKAAVMDWVGRHDRAEADHAAPDWAEFDDLSRRTRELVETFVNVTAGDGFTYRQAASRELDAVVARSAAAMLAGITICAVAVFLLHRRAAAPVRTAAEVARRVASGDIDLVVPQGGNDAYGALLRAVEAMRLGMVERIRWEAGMRAATQARVVEALDQSADGFMLVDAEGAVVVANRVAVDILGLGHDEVRPGDAVADVRRRAVARGVYAHAGSLGVDPGRRFDGEAEIPGGRHIRVIRTPLQEGGFVSIIADVTASRQQRLALEEANARLDAALSLRERNDGLIESVATNANASSDEAEAARHALREVLERAGWDCGACYATGAGGVLSPIGHAGDDASRAAMAGPEAVRALGPSSLPGRVVATGAPAWVDRIADDAGCGRREGAAALGLVTGAAFPVMVGRDVVAVIELFSKAPSAPDPGLMQTMAQVGKQVGRVFERTAAARRLRHDATHDALTGLPNRTLFSERLDQAIAEERAGGAGYGVVFIDLDRFKLVNDSLGHDVGDRFLVEVAGRFARTAADFDGRAVLARLGGDEFVVLVKGDGGVERGRRLSDGLLAALRPEVVVDGHAIRASASLGVTSSEAGYASASDALRDADVAMYSAKSAGRGRVAVFDQDLRDEATRRLKTENDLWKGLRDAEFRLFFQPIVRTCDGGLDGYEALVRWEREPGVMEGPIGFIPVAEEIGLIVPLGAWIMREACRAAERWNRGLPPGEALTVSVNCSPHQLRDPDFAAMVERTLAETGCRPGLVKVEVTESVAIHDYELTKAVLERLDAIGVQPVLDDFGTGYSSLGHLHNLPFRSLKLDKSFIANLSGNGSNVLRATCGLARSFGMSVVAEGVETEEALAAVREAGCGLVQGYLFSRPMPEERLWRPDAAAPPRPALPGAAA